MPSISQRAHTPSSLPGAPAKEESKTVHRCCPQMHHNKKGEAIMVNVVIGTETWLNSTINSNEIIKSVLGFNVYRKDRPNKSYGGVLIAVTNDLISSVVTDLDTDCKILWVQIDLIGTKSLHIGSFYRPPNSDMTALDNLNLSLERLTHRTNGNIWLGGDFNAPHIDWSSMEVSPMAGGRRQEQQRLIDISLDHNIEQTIDKPTRGGNILDLLFINNKSTLQHLQLGKSDHDIIYAEINVRPNRVCTPHRKVFSFRKADWDGIKRKLNALFEKMQENSKQPPVDELWNTNPVQLGGFDVNGQPIVVEIDESYFFHRKYHRGRFHNGLWVFGAVERESGR